MTIEERYQNDAWFHRLVDMIYSFIEECKFTPNELREAVIYVAILYELKHFPTPLHKIYDKDRFGEYGDKKE